MEILKTVDSWFLILAIVLLGGFSGWASNFIFSSTISRLEKSIDKLADTLKEANSELKIWINELFDARNDHDHRLTQLETKCDLQHNTKPRESGGRRHYDPKTSIPRPKI